MPGFGQKLRRERESRKVTLHEIAEATRISVRYLEALESDDLQKLPGSVFNKGYVRAYAQFIGADAKRLVDAYVHEEEIQQREGRISRPDVLAGLAEAIERSPGQRRAHGSRWRVPLVILLSAGVVTLAGWSYFSFLRPDARAPAGRPPPVESLPPAAVEAAGPEPVEPVSPVEAEPQPLQAPPQPPPSVEASTELEPSRVTGPPVEAQREEAPVPAPERPRPAATLSASASGLSIREFGVGTGVANRQLVGRADQFARGTRVWFWNRVIGGKPGDHIRHVWLHEGKEVGSTKLNLGGSHWRTQSRKTLRATGQWAVEARDAQGLVVARSEFSCVPKGS